MDDNDVSLVDPPTSQGFFFLFCFLDPPTSQGPGELLRVPTILLQAARESSLSGVVYFI